MIVKIAGVLYLLQAVLGLWSMSGPLGVRATLANLVVFLVSGLFAALGVGMFTKASWARWLALGSSLLGWTLGTLVFLGVLAAMFLMGAAGSMLGAGIASLIGFFMVLVVLMFVISIVINFLLYFYLRSEAGAAEFGVERESFGNVMGSVGVWVAIFIVQFGVSTSPFWTLFPSRDSDSDETAAAQSQAYEKNSRFQNKQREFEEQRRALERAQLEAQERERLEAEQLAQAQPADELVAEAEAPAARYEPTVSATQPESTEKPKNGILKCRDAGGAVQYTQVYCPPGTKQVEMQANY